jgi:hypothetical protein
MPRQRNTRQKPRNRNIARSRNLEMNFEAIRTRGNPLPPTVLSSVLLTFKVQYTVLYTSPTAGILTPSGAVAGVPGGFTTWNRLRVLHIEIWGPDISVSTGSSAVLLELGSIGSGTDNASFRDSATIGNQRAHISVRPSLLYRST